MLLEGAIGLAGGLLGAVASALAIVRTLRAPVAALEEKVCRLEQEKVHALEEQFKRHLNEDKSQRMLALLEGIQSNMAGMGAKIDRLCEVSAKHEAMIASNERGFSAIPQSSILFREGRPLVMVDGEPSGIELDGGRYIWHRGLRRGLDAARGGLVRPLAWLYCFGSIGVKDMAAFIERHGMPFIVGKVDQAGVESERSAVKRLIRNFGPSGGGVFSRNVEVQLMESSSQGEVYFRLMDYIGDAVTRVLLGQTASSGDSAGLSKGDAQSRVRQDILEADCRRIASCIQRQVVRQWMAYNAPGVAEPRFVMEYEAPEDRGSLAQTVATLAQAGFVADEAELSRRFGMKLTHREPAGAANGLPPVMMGGEAETSATGVSEAASALRAGFGAVLRDADGLSGCEDPVEFRRLLEAMCGEVSQAGLDTSALERVAEETMYGGFVAGVQGADSRLAKGAEAMEKRKAGNGER